MEKIFRVGNAIQKEILGKLGYKLVRLKDSKTIRNKMYADPLDALVSRQLGLKSSFECPIELCRQETGFGFGPNQWHPFVATLKEYAAGNTDKYKDSILQKFYNKWNPKNAAEVLAGFEQAPDCFSDFPPYGYYLIPWRPDSSLENLKAEIELWSGKDFNEHGHKLLNMESDGLKTYGPVSRRFGEFEYDRLISIYEKIKKEGYLREHGDVKVMMVRDNKSYVFLTGGGGLHRAAAMAVLGYKTVPATFTAHKYYVDVKDVRHWAQVRSQLWKPNEATGYVKYLFSFDSQGWAEKNIY